MGAVIGSVTRSREELQLGDCVLIEVLDAAGGPLSEDPAVLVSINGVLGARQWLQPEHPGSFPVLVCARRGDEVETSAMELPVAAPAAPPEQEQVEAGAIVVRALRVPGVPLLQLAKAGDTPYRASFSVTAQNPTLPASGPQRLARRVVRRPGQRPLATLEQLGGNVAALEAAFLAQPAAPRPTYAWDFGDGTTATTQEPWAEHDFESSLGPDEAHRVFDVAVRFQDPDGTPREMVRSLSVHNAYAICKQRGTLVPRFASSGFASPLFGGFEATVTVTNIEPGPLTLTSRRVRLSTWEADSEDLFGPEEPLSPPLVIPGGQSASVPIVVLHAQVPKDAPGFSVCLAGTSEQGLPVRVECQFDISRADQESSGIRLGALAVTHLHQFRDLVDEASILVTQAQQAQPEQPEHEGPFAVHVERHHLPIEEQVRIAPVEQRLRAQPVEELHLQQANRIPFEVPGEGVDAQAVQGLREGLHLERRLAPSVLAQAGLADSPALVNPAAGAAVELRSNLSAGISLLSPDTASTDAGLFRAVSAELLHKSLWDTILASDPQEGATCDPDNVDAPEGWACQATGRVENKQVPGRFLNARKGDIILSPGGLGMIGGMLMSVSPPQRYAHCGIMTNNHTEITHSTGAGDRVEAYPVGSILGEAQPTEGHRPDIVKYGWPGVVTQSVEDAVNGSYMLDPETAGLPEDQRKWYRIATFTPGRSGMPVQGVWEMVPALVVKPDPMQETPQIRRRLREIAASARGEAGRSHYRFFCYTDPTIGLTSTAPPEAGWAAGTYPSVCSSFLWMLMRRHGVALEAGADPATEGSLEPADRAAGGQVSGQSLDGLYFYTAAERRAAGEYLYKYLHAKVLGKAEEEAGILGDLANLFSDMADDVASQICNTFAFDWSDTEAKDSERWRDEARDASAVSPDNILLWDGPGAQGLYGYAEPLHYRERRIEPVAEHAWHQVTRFATVRGRVLFQGNPSPGVLVQLYDGMEDFSDANGAFLLERVPHGRYRLKAGGRDVGGVLLAAEEDLVVDRDDLVHDVLLGGPPEQFRRVAVTGSMHIVDFEDFASDEVVDRPFGRDFLVGPFHTHEDFTFVERMGGEVRVELRVIMDWRLDNGVDIRWEHRFFEGASEDTDDLDGQADKNFTLAAGWWQSWNTRINSGGAGESSIDVLFDNQVNPS